jgi:hypothetical protein
MENQILKIELTYNQETKHLTVNGAITDPIITLGIIEKAKQVILDFHSKLNKQVIDQMNASLNK